MASCRGRRPRAAASPCRARARAVLWCRRHADEAGSWDRLHDCYEVKLINHEEAYSDGESCTNWAEQFFSRMSRAEIGHHHHIAGPYLLRYAQEAAWREDGRRVSNGDQVCRLGKLALSAKPSVDFSGYWQRHKGAA